MDTKYKSTPLLILVAGASGDLAIRKTYPALLQLYNAQNNTSNINCLPPQFTICGVARTKQTHDLFNKKLFAALQNTGVVALNERKRDDNLQSFLTKSFYEHIASYDDAKKLQAIIETYKNALLQSTDTKAHGGCNILVYLATPPHVFGIFTHALNIALNDKPTNGFVRIVLEKPFGRDLTSCQHLLNTIMVEQKWAENQLFFIDHYLGKASVNTILVDFRKRNPLLDKLWNNRCVESVHIILKETLTIQGRSGYFDDYGIIRDVIQNHLLQLLTLVAMDLPTGESSIRGEKVKVLQSMDPIPLQHCLLGQYDGYENDLAGEKTSSSTATYACIRTSVNTPKWQSVPFCLEAGKALDESICEIRLYLRRDILQQQCAIVIRIQPDPCVSLLTTSVNGSYRNSLDYSLNQKNTPTAYTKLIHDAIVGEQVNFVKSNELLEAWRIFTPLLQEIEDNNAGLPNSLIRYKPHTLGPLERRRFLKSVGIFDNHAVEKAAQNMQSNL